mmetsp:Transcript_23569/g.55838  ORF Transcript_23569/g.55838 Transcript_23569/m.55838 type:complete len:226 (-) Transcript_23569:488-1165(-)
MKNSKMDLSSRNDDGSVSVSRRRGCSCMALLLLSTMMLLAFTVSVVDVQVSAFSPSSSSSSRSQHRSIVWTKLPSSSKLEAAHDPRQQQQQQQQQRQEGSEPVLLSRRQWWYSSATKAVAFSGGVGIASGVFSATTANAADATTGVLVDELKSSKDKLDEIPVLLQNQEWDKVRTILKTPPVNKLWNLGDSQNTVLKLAKESGDVDLFELKDELALSLQMCDQLT